MISINDKEESLFEHGDCFTEIEELMERTMQDFENSEINLLELREIRAELTFYIEVDFGNAEYEVKPILEMNSRIIEFCITN